MKNLSYILLALLFTSCSMEEDPRDQIPEEEIYTSATDLYRNTIATLYTYVGGAADGQGLQGTCRGVWDLQTLSSDEAVVPTRGIDWYDGGLWQSFYKHSWNDGNEIVSNSWYYLYKVITLCNRSLETLKRNKALAGDYYNEWHYEIRALRAMYYWYLIDLFGDVPLVTSTNISMNDVTRESRSNVFKFCEDELKAALIEVKSTASNHIGEYYGRITKEVVLFLRGSVFLFLLLFGFLCVQLVGVEDFKVRRVVYLQVLGHVERGEVLVVEGYAIFFHIEEPIAIIYKLNSSRDNILMDYQLTAASIFGLDDEKSIAKQDREGFFVSNNEEWEDFLTAMTASGHIDTESTAVLQVTTVSTF